MPDLETTAPADPGALSSPKDAPPPQAFWDSALRDGLSKATGKQIPSGWLYDALGSVLFEAITLLPEYGLTRADERVIARCAPRLAQYIPNPSMVVELGSGSGRKTRVVLEALAAATPALSALTYAPVDVSASALEACQQAMQGLSGIQVQPVVSAYLEGLYRALQTRSVTQPVLVLFLGSTIGNFQRHEVSSFLADLRRHLLPGDFLLLGADLEKPAAQLELAYDDPAGVTAAFNRNILGHINRSLGADFPLHRFRHLAIYNRQERRIEMYLESTESQEVWMEDLDLRVHLHKGERILTEYSYKFRLEELRGFAGQASFVPVEEWVDRDWPFAECLWRAR